MKSSDKRILLIVGGLVAIGALWFGLISPKRAELSDLESQVAERQASVTEQEATASTAQAAKEGYETDYRDLITLGKAVPAGDDSSSLIDQIDGLANAAGAEFLGLQLSEGAGTAVAPPPEASGSNAASGDAPASGDAASSGGTPATPTAAPATETAAADLPLGATIGSAGLPVMPYELTLRGTFFEIADFIKGLNGMVETGANGIQVDGRLLTVDSFELHPDEDEGFPQLSVTLTTTAYVAPPDQGLAAGATPTTPAGAGTPATAPAATASPAAPTPTASVTP